MNRGRWYYIPLNMKSSEIERMLYQKGQVIFWYFKELNQFMLTPFTLDEGLDAIGRYVYVRPVPMADNNKDAEEAAKKTPIGMLMAQKRLRVIYEPQIEENFLTADGEFDEGKVQDLLENSAVIIYDRTPSYSQTIVPRVQMQEGILDVMSECIPFARTAMENATGVEGMRVPDPDDASNVLAANASLQHAALNGEKFVPIVGNIEFQPLTSGGDAKAQEFMQTMQFLNNFRLSNYGIDNTGLYDKKAYVNNNQSGINNVGLTLQDTVSNRQDACAIIDSIWDLKFWYELSDTVTGADINMDGIDYDRSEAPVASQE